MTGGLPKDAFDIVGARAGSGGTDMRESQGYFKDAWHRFRKNKASLTALIIIFCIVLFAFTIPIVYAGRDSTFLDPYYAKKGPRIASLSGSVDFLSGRTKRTVSERGMIRLLAIGKGASEGGEYSPILKYKRIDRTSSRAGYSVSVDSYLEVGFVYMNISSEEYYDILDFEAREGIRVLYPLIEANSLCPDPADANAWFCASARGDAVMPVYEDGELIDTEIIPFSPDMELVDNYKRDANGEPVTYQYSGGGTLESAQRRVRVLYHNYFMYKNSHAPSYLLGTDSQGYDLALRLAGGIRLSLLLALSVTAINLVIGSLLGALMGYYGGTLDLLLSRVIDIISGVPSIVVQTLFQIYLASRVGVVVSLLFAFVLTGWIGTAVRVRGQYYRFKGMEYVMSARTLGASDGRIMWKHIFPNTLGTVITASVLIIPGVIFTESMLSFLGIVNLGGSRVTSLGALLSDASGIWTGYPHLMLYPALVISLLMICFNLFGNGLRDAFNPTLRGAE